MQTNSQFRRQESILRATFLLVVGLLSQSLFAAPTQESEWSTNFELAKNRALHSKKDLLLCFTLEKWSPVSQRMEERILSHPAFAAALKEDFELVWLDLSNKSDETSSSELEELKNLFEIQQFPTLVLANTQGVPYAYTGYIPGDVATYAQHLESLRMENLEREMLVESAQGAPDPIRAEILSESIPNLGGQRTAKFYGDLMREILALDPESESALVADFRRQLADYTFYQEMERLKNAERWDEMVAMTDTYIAEHQLEGSRKQAALMSRYLVQSQKGDWDGMLESLAEVIRIDPDSPDGQRASDILSDYAAELKISMPLQSSL